MRMPRGVPIFYHKGMIMAPGPFTDSATPIYVVLDRYTSWAELDLITLIDEATETLTCLWANRHIFCFNLQESSRMGATFNHFNWTTSHYHFTFLFELLKWRASRPSFCDPLFCISSNRIRSLIPYEFLGLWLGICCFEWASILNTSLHLIFCDFTLFHNRFLKKWMDERRDTKLILHPLID